MNKIYNTAYLHEISSGDEEFMLDLINQFINETPAVLERFEQLAELKQWRKLYEEVHKYAANFSIVGIQCIEKQVFQLETNSKNQENLEDIPILIKNIKACCTDAIIQMQQDFLKMKK